MEFASVLWTALAAVFGWVVFIRRPVGPTIAQQVKDAFRTVSSGGQNDDSEKKEKKEGRFSWDGSPKLGSRHGKSEPRRGGSGTIDRVIVITNPVSGMGVGSAMAEAITDGIHLSAKIPVELVVTERSGHAAEVVGNQPLSVDELDDDGDDAGQLFVVCGGDGTASEVIDAARRRPDAERFLKRAVFAVVPTGTGNGLAASAFHDNPKKAPGVSTLVEKTVAGIAAVVAAAATGDDSSLERVDAETVGLDILAVQSVGFAPQGDGGPDSPGHCSPTTSFGAGRPRHGVLCWGWGAMSDFCFWTEIEFRGHWWREIVAVALLFVKGKFHYKGTIEFEDAETGKITTLEGRFFNVMCVNTSHIATDAHVAPDAQPDDGVIHLVVMRECSRVTGLRTFLLSETCDHLDMPHVEMYRARLVRVTPADLGDGGCMSLDGDIIQYGPTEITIEPSMGSVLWASSNYNRR